MRVKFYFSPATASIWAECQLATSILCILILSEPEFFELKNCPNFIF
jgi:hypothetical protein